MATTSVLGVSLGLGVSVIADRRSTVVGSPRQLQRERPWEEVKCTLGGGSWLKTLLEASCGARSCARLLPFWLPLFESGSGC